MKLRSISLLLTLLLVSSLPAATTVYLDSKVYDTASVPLVSHTGTGHFQSYLVLNVPYKPVLAVNKKISKAIGRKLKTRGEAHITVITPPEYDNALKGVVSIERIHQIAEQWAMQEMTFDIICIGSGAAKLGQKMEETFYLVVTSKDLLHLRQEIEKLYLQRGGKAGAFQASKFYPHITIGYTKKDLHIHQGVIKDASSKDKRFKLSIGP